jgi:hypothetical protein
MKAAPNVKIRPKVGSYPPIASTSRLAAASTPSPGLTPRSAIEKFAAVLMIDLRVPTTDGRELLLTRYTEPEPKLALLIHNLKFVLPDQPKPKITTVPRPPRTPL